MGEVKLVISGGETFHFILFFSEQTNLFNSLQLKFVNMTRYQRGRKDVCKLKKVAGHALPFRGATNGFSGRWFSQYATKLRLLLV